MISREMKIRVGLFFLAGTILAVVLIVSVLGKALFKEEKVYHIAFRNTSVSGLEVGSSVKYQGIAIGTVKDISINRKDIAELVVTIAVEMDTPIKRDMKAALAMMGITGMKQIELYGGTNISPELEEGSFINTGSSALADITGDAQVIADKVELLLNNLNSFARRENQEAFTGILLKIDYILESNAEDLGVTIANARTISSDLTSAAADLETVSAELKRLTDKGKLNRLTDELISAVENINSQAQGWGDALPPERIEAISQNIEEFTATLKRTETAEILAQTEEVMRELKGILGKAGETSETVDMAVIRSTRNIVRAIDTLNETMRNLNEFSRVISHDPSRLINF